ncbi:MAG: hypothetical protein ACKVP3_26345 [Hyphomicrobiaceae bacterium]
MRSTFIVLATLAGMGSALAQTTQAPPPPAGPTEDQCRAGYQQGMEWTQAQFTKACADLEQKKKP